MSTAKIATRGAAIAALLCAIFASPSADPLTMMMVGAFGAVIAFFALWWLFSRRMALQWNRRQKLAWAGSLILVVVVATWLLAEWRVAASLS